MKFLFACLQDLVESIVQFSPVIMSSTAYTSRDKLCFMVSLNHYVSIYRHYVNFRGNRNIGKAFRSTSVRVGWRSFIHYEEPWRCSGVDKCKATKNSNQIQATADFFLIFIIMEIVGKLHSTWERTTHLKHGTVVNHISMVYTNYHRSYNCADT